MILYYAGAHSLFTLFLISYLVYYSNFMFTTYYCIDVQPMSISIP